MLNLRAISVAIVLAGIVTHLHAAAPLEQVVTYQGRLNQNGSAFSGSVDARGVLFDAGIGGNAVGSIAEVLGVSVTDGLFLVEFDFGENAFGTVQRWLEVSVRGQGEPTYTTLTPRQKITAAPQSLGPWSVINGNAIFSSGNVGIGTSTPTAQLAIDGLLTSLAALRVDAPGNSTGSILQSSPNGVPGFIGFANNGNRRDIRFGEIGMNFVVRDSPSIPFDTNGLFIAESGNVGIGTTFPGVRLDVRGDISSNSLVKSPAFEYPNPRERVMTVSGMDFFPVYQGPGEMSYSHRTALFTNSTGYFDVAAPLELPDGATITGVTIIFRDSTALNAFNNLILERYDLLTVANDWLFTGAWSGSNGVTQFDLNPFAGNPADYVVDKQSYGYTLIVGGDWEVNNTALYGARVTYTVAGPE